MTTEELSDEPPRLAGARDSPLSRVQAYAGITRVADVTGLDRIGIPVVMVIRPGSRGFVVAQGKGFTREQADISGIMESLEGYCAENIDRPLIYRSVGEMRELGRVVEPADLPRARKRVVRPGERLFWIEGRKWPSGELLWVPFEAVHADYSAPSGIIQGHVLVSSTGLAAAIKLEAAILHALCEVIERDAFSLFERARLWSDPAHKLTFDDCKGEPLCILERLRERSFEVHAWTITSDIGVPVICATILDTKAPPGTFLRLASGLGCHPIAERALTKALLEAVQSRATAISGSRDDLTYFDYRITDSDLGHDREAGFSASSVASLPRDLTCAVDIVDQLEAVVGALSARGFQDVVVVRLNRADIGVAVVRVIVPGLEGPHLHPDYTPGRRALAAQ